MNKYAQFDDEFVESFESWLFPPHPPYLSAVDSLNEVWEDVLGALNKASLDDDRHIASLTGALPWEL